MKRTVTIHVASDRHSEIHGRSFSETREATVNSIDIQDAVKKALRNTKLANLKGKVHITVDWPHT